MMSQKLEEEVCTDNFTPESAVKFKHDAVILDMDSRYIGVDGVKLSMTKKPDSNHKEYYGALLKERSFKKVLDGREPLIAEYLQFYSEQMETNKPTLKSFVSGLFSSPKLPQKEAEFFSNLEAIVGYMRGDDVKNIGCAFNYVGEHRSSYVSVLDDKDKLSDDVEVQKKKIMERRYLANLNAFSKYAETNIATNNMIQITEDLTDDVLSMFKDMNIEMPLRRVKSSFKDELYVTILENDCTKMKLFENISEIYAGILQNPAVTDKSQAISALNNLHEKIFGVKRKFVEEDKSQTGYKLIQHQPQPQIVYVIKK